jgi:hypothetical protein
VPANARACTRLPPQDFHGKEGVDGSSPSEGFKKASKWPFLLPGCCTHVPRRPLNLSPGPVPSITDGESLWLEQRLWEPQSTSVLERGSNKAQPTPGEANLEAPQTLHPARKPALGAAFRLTPSLIERGSNQKRPTPCEPEGPRGDLHRGSLHEGPGSVRIFV